MVEIEEFERLVLREISCFFLSNESIPVLLQKAKDVIREVLPEALIYQQDYSLNIDNKATMIFHRRFANAVEITYKYPVEEVEKYLHIIYQVGGKFDNPAYIMQKDKMTF
ncbi:unnamed protein product [Hymenolepis diminuta]|uniref:Uncharacterized protein n=1 Tax=Hymenolepis diminuta TaxID=6216 RepID=A0A564XZK3_HYMDI|nr:unnamed protein product [Hymenolepis diminuta]